MFDRTPSLDGSSVEDSRSLAGWGISVPLGHLGETVMTKQTYFEKLKDPRWQRKRLECMAAANWTCFRCAETERTLHVHHIRYIKGREPWEYSTEELTVLCEQCHQESHEELALLTDLLGRSSFNASSIVGLTGGYLAASDSADPSLAAMARESDCSAFGLGVVAYMIGLLPMRHIRPLLHRIIELRREDEHTELSAAELRVCEFMGAD